MIEIFQISRAQFLSMVEADDATREVAKQATEIIVGMLDREPLCFILLTPLTLISTQAYVWMMETELSKKHRITIAKYSKGMLETILLKYSDIFGYCFVPKQWLLWLGAEFTSENEFVIRRV